VGASVCGEAFFNLLHILSECQGALERERVEPELEVFSQRAESDASASEAALESRSRSEKTLRAG